ncbi:hypothetical protein FACS1894164_20000 [Spirochaetia bacterium]|nr:hypothetical protein FACS1894164_20000 [Spirochaetia bacterium]
MRKIKVYIKQERKYMGDYYYKADKMYENLQDLDKLENKH